MSKVIPVNFQGYEISFNNDGWINATDAAERFGKRPAKWLELSSTKNYIAALANILDGEADVRKKDFGLVKAKKGGNNQGTWLHPKLAVAFARWLSDEFAVWCDMQIDNLIRNGKDWKISRRESALGYRSMSDAVSLVRQALGKEIKPHHFINEARLINGIMTGVYKGRDRDQLSREELDLVILLENRNSILIAMGHSYDQRKKELIVFLAQLTIKHIAA